MPKSNCKLCQILTQIKGRDLDKVREALDLPSPPKQLLADVLTRHGYSVTEASIRRHLKGSHVHR